MKHVLFTARVKNLLSYYLKAKHCDTYEELCDFIVADKLKDSMSMSCLKHCLTAEGEKVLSASEIAHLADVYESNYYPDGRYKSCDTDLSELQGSWFSKAIPTTPGFGREH